MYCCAARSLYNYVLHPMPNIFSYMHVCCCVARVAPMPHTISMCVTVLHPCPIQTLCVLLCCTHAHTNSMRVARVAPMPHTISMRVAVLLVLHPCLGLGGLCSKVSQIFFFFYSSIIRLFFFSFHLFFFSFHLFFFSMYLLFLTGNNTLISNSTLSM